MFCKMPTESIYSLEFLLTLYFTMPSQNQCNTDREDAT